MNPSPEVVEAGGHRARVVPPLVCAAWCVVLACADFDQRWIYDLSKWAICSVACYQAFTETRKWARFALVLIAIIFNPIARIHFESSEWMAVDWISAIGFVATLPGLSFRWLTPILRDFTFRDYFGTVTMGLFLYAAIYSALHPRTNEEIAELAAKKKAAEKAKTEAWAEQMTSPRGSRSSNAYPYSTTPRFGDRMFDPPAEFSRSLNLPPR